MEGQTILQAAKANGKYIPTLCDLEGLTPVGACRICIVEVSGIDRLIPACTTPIQDGMSVTTSSPRLTHNRRISLELLFSRAQPCVCGLRVEWPLRIAVAGQRNGNQHGALCVQLSQAGSRRSPIRASCSTTTAASCAPGVCAYAQTWRERMCGR